MSGFLDAVKEVLRFLSEWEALSDVTFCEDYPAAKKDSPLRRITVAVGLERAECTPDVLGRFIGERDGHALTGYPWTLRIRLQIHAPNRLGGSACQETFERIWEALFFDAPFAVTAAGCGPVSARKETGSLELNAWIEMKLQGYREEGEKNE